MTVKKRNTSCVKAVERGEFVVVIAILMIVAGVPTVVCKHGEAK